MQTFLTFVSMDRTLKCDHSLENHSAVLNCRAVYFSILPGFYFGIFFNFGLGTSRSEKVKYNCVRIKPFSFSNMKSVEAKVLL